MQDYIYLYSKNGTLVETVKETSASLYEERLSGELLLSFETKFKRLPVVDDGAYLIFRGQKYSITKLSKTSAGSEFLVNISAEQASISFVDDDIEDFSFAGTVQEALSRLLSDTEFTGESNITDTIGIAAKNTNRRAVLLEIAVLCGGEIEYDGSIIRILKKRGKVLHENIINLAKCYNVRELSEKDGYTGKTKTLSYELSGIEPMGYSVGDEVPLVFTPLGIDTTTRIIRISYDPFNCTSVSIEAGDYVKDTASEELEREKLYLKKTEAEILIEKYINSADGTAAITSALTGTYVTADELNNYVSTAELGTSIKQYINGAEGKASIVSAVSGSFVAKPVEPEYSNPSGSSYSFSLESDGYYTSTNVGVDSSYSYGKFTFNTTTPQTITLQCISYGENNFDYGLISVLNATLTYSKTADSSNVLYSFYGKSSSQPVKIKLDIPAGESFITFKYIKDGSGSAGDDRFKIRVVGGYVTDAEMSTAIKQEVTAFGASLSLSVSNGEKSSVISLNKDGVAINSQTIQFTGNVLFASDLGPDGTTSIDGGRITTGKINAALVDTSDLIVENVWLKSGIIPNTKVLTSELLSANNLTVRLGVQQDNGWAQYLEVYGTAIYFGRPGYIPSSDSNALMFDMANRSIFPAMTRTWSIGSEDAKFLNAYVEAACVDEILFKSGGAYESSLYVTSGGDLRFIDRDGLSHTIVNI